MQTMERLEDVLRKTLALQESIRARMSTLAIREILKSLAIGAQLAEWLDQADEIHQEACRELHQTVLEMKRKKVALDHKAGDHEQGQ